MRKRLPCHRILGNLTPGFRTRLWPPLRPLATILGDSLPGLVLALLLEKLPPLRRSLLLLLFVLLTLGNLIREFQSRHRLLLCSLRLILGMPFLLVTLRLCLSLALLVLSELLLGPATLTLGM